MEVGRQEATTDAGALVVLLDDENASTVCAGIQYAITLFRELLQLLVRETVPINAAKYVSELKLLKDKVLQILITRKNHTGIQLRAIKFLEMLVLCFTNADAVRKQGDTFCLEDVPPVHLVLAQAALAREGRDYLNALIQQVKDAGSCTGALAAINCLCAVVHQRSSLASTVVPALARYCDSMPDFSSTQVTSYKHTLANALQSITKLPYGNAYTDVVAGCMSTLGLSSSRRQYKRPETRPEPTPEPEASQPPPSAEVSPFVPPSTGFSAPPPVLPPAQPEPLSPDAIANILLDNILTKLPLTPPPPNEPLPSMDVQNLITFFAVLTQQVLQRQSQLQATPAPRLDPRRDPRLMREGGPAPEGIPVQPVPGPVPVPGVPGPFGPMGGMPTIPQQPLPIPVAAPMPTVPLMPPVTPVLPMQPMPVVAEVPKALPKQEPPKLRVPVLSPSQLVTLNNLAYERILLTEDTVKTGGGSALRQSLLVRLAGLRNVDDPCVRMLLDHIAENCYGRHELAITLLYQEYVNAKRTATRSKVKKLKLDIDAPIKEEKMEDGKSKSEPDDAMEINDKEEKEESKSEMDMKETEDDIYGRDNSEPMARYEFFVNELLAILKEKLEPSNDLFTRLLLDAPELTPSAIQAVKAYCEDEMRVVLGLNTLKDLISQRPPYSAQCLQILLTYTIHKVEFVRSAAIKLAANTLFLERPTLEPTIEEFAFVSLHNMIEVMKEKAKLAPQEGKGEEGEGEAKEDGTKETEKEKEKPKEEKEKEKDEEKKMDIDDVAEADGGDETKPSRKRKRGEEGTVGGEENGDEDEEKEESEENYIRRHILLAFALCARKHSLLAQIVESYCLAPVSVKKEMHKQTSGLIRVIGMDSPEFLHLINHCPKGADTFVLQALHILTDDATPSAQLVAAVKGLHHKRSNDARFMIPILAGLHKDEALELLPKLINLPSNILKNVVHRLLHYKPTPLTPEELLVALHTLDPQKEKVPLRKVIEAIQLCFNQKVIYKQQIMAVVLQQLVDVLPIPPLLMRTVLQAIGAFPKMMGFIMGILSRLITKQVWNDKRLWKGFMKCVKMTLPHSCPVVIQLPPQQLEEVLKKMPTFKAPIIQYYEENPSANMSLSLQQLLGLREST